MLLYTLPKFLVRKEQQVIIGPLSAHKTSGPYRAGRETTDRRLITVQRQAQLFQVIGALRTAGGLARRLHCRQQQGNQDRR